MQMWYKLLKYSVVFVVILSLLYIVFDISWRSIDSFQKKKTRDTYYTLNLKKTWTLLNSSKGMTLEKMFSDNLWEPIEKENLMINEVANGNYCIFSQQAGNGYVLVKYLYLLHFSGQKLDNFSCLLINYTDRTIANIINNECETVTVSPNIWYLNKVDQEKEFQRIAFRALHKN